LGPDWGEAIDSPEEVLSGARLHIVASLAPDYLFVDGVRCHAAKRKRISSHPPDGREYLDSFAASCYQGAESPR